jgi:hypothetical protein
MIPVNMGLLKHYLLTKTVIKITRNAIASGATERTIIQIASFLNVNLSSLMLLTLAAGLPRLRLGCAALSDDGHHPAEDGLNWLAG